MVAMIIGRERRGRDKQILHCVKTEIREGSGDIKITRILKDCGVKDRDLVSVYRYMLSRAPAKARRY